MCSPGWARTSDLVINSHALYRLSYRGVSDPGRERPTRDGKSVIPRPCVNRIWRAGRSAAASDYAPRSPFMASSRGRASSARAAVMCLAQNHSFQGGWPLAAEASMRFCQAVSEGRMANETRPPSLPCRRSWQTAQMGGRMASCVRNGAFCVKQPVGGRRVLVGGPRKRVDLCCCEPGLKLSCRGKGPRQQPQCASPRRQVSAR